MNNIEFSLMWNEPITSTDGAYHHQLTKATYASAENRRGTIFTGQYLKPSRGQNQQHYEGCIVIFL